MSFYLSALAVVILILFGLLLLRKMRTQASRQPQPKADVPLTPQAQLYKLQKNERFWGVSVESHCSASSGLAGKQFPFLGRLPGDIHVKSERFDFYFPLTTCLVISLLLTLILFLVVR